METQDRPKMRVVSPVEVNCAQDGVLKKIVFTVGTVFQANKVGSQVVEPSKGHFIEVCNLNLNHPETGEEIVMQGIPWSNIQFYEEE